MRRTEVADDKRFKDPAWLTLPCSLYRRAYSVADGAGRAMTSMKAAPGSSVMQR